MQNWEKEQEGKIEKLMSDFADIANSYSNKNSIFCKEFTRHHRTLQQSMFGTILQIVAFVATDDYRTDGRNQQSKEIAKMLIAGYAEELKKYYIVDGASESRAESYKQTFLANPKDFLSTPLI